MIPVQLLANRYCKELMFRSGEKMIIKWWWAIEEENGSLAQNRTKITKQQHLDKNTDMWSQINLGTHPATVLFQCWAVISCVMYPSARPAAYACI